MARTKSRGKPKASKKEDPNASTARVAPTDYASQYDSLDNDVLHDEESDNDNYDYDQKDGRKYGDEEETEEEPAYMLFDFRLGPSSWPLDIEYIDPKRAEELLEKAASVAAEEAARAQKKEGDTEAKASESREGTKKSSSTGTSNYSSSRGEDTESSKQYPAPPESSFETLKDGSSALIIKPGYRLKLNLNSLLEGGDANREERLKEIEKEKKLYAKYGYKWESHKSYEKDFKDSKDEDIMMYDNRKWFKEYINEYTITIDMKLTESAPREGISLYQTALIHSDANKRTGKTTLSKSDGECILNASGGVGIFGTYGDITKARVDTGVWRRVVVSVKCVDSKTESGEMRTWVGVEPGIIVKEDAFTANDRFAIDPDGFYMFSSGQSAMMPGKISVRSIRIDAKFSVDDDVRSNRARDKILSMFTEERKKEIDKQRQGLSLKSLFPKPRPMWSASAFVAFFGDAFIENSTLEGSSNLTWSYIVLNHALQQMLDQKLLLHEEYGLSFTARTGLSDTLHILNQSSLVFKAYLRMLQSPNESQLLSFLKKLKKFITGLTVGNSLLLPMYIENRELAMFLERINERSYRAVIIQTDSEKGLTNHAVNASENFPLVSYRTCLILNNIPKKNVLDDVFWMGVYNMAVHSHEGDTARFYDVLIPFLTGKSLEASLVEAEKSSLEYFDKASAGNIYELCGPMRFPQRSKTAYVRCILESINYIFLCRGLSVLEACKINLCLGLELVSMMKNDLTHLYPDQNGNRVCSLALRELSTMAVNLIDLSHKFPGEKTNTTLVLTEIHTLVEESNKILSFSGSDETLLPPDIDLKGPETIDPNDPALTQYQDSLSWNVSQNDPDPGQSVSLRKYIPVDFLQLPKRASTRREAIKAIRMCDRLCTLTKNQNHCIKNDSFLILSVIENVFTQIVPLPKPRGVILTMDEIYISERTQRRAEKKKAKEAQKEEEMKKKKLEEVNSKKSKNKKQEALPTQTQTTVSKPNFIGDEETPLFAEGIAVEERITELPCIWDEPISYELQVELLLALRRISELLVMATFSIHQSRHLDSICIIVAGCIAAISDAIIRQIAIDEPSEVCAHLVGKTLEGRQLGHPGFGISVGTFATQCETLEIHSPELNIAKTAVLDYFQSPNQKRLDKIFSWEEDYINKPGKNLIKYIRMVCREIGLACPSPHNLMLDGQPITSELFKNFPEFHCYRDIVYWWKYMLNTDRKVFPNYMNSDQPCEVTALERMSCQLSFSWDDSRGGYYVQSFGRELHCRPDPKQNDPVTGKPIPLDQLPVNRFPSTATPSFYLPAPAVKTEDDVIYRPNLPNFEDKHGQVLNQRDSELLISYLTVPYMRIPLILTFFASEDRIHKLQSNELRLILDSVLFEPGKYLRMDMSTVQPVMVPSPQSDLLASPFGFLMNELCRSPDTVIRSVLSLLRGALACDTGSVVDEGSTTFNVSTLIILYAARLGCRVDNYISFLIDYTLGKHDCIDWPLREMNISDDILSILVKGQAEIRELIHNQLNQLFEDYLKRLDQEIVKDPNNEKMIDRNSRLACDLHAHKLLAYRNYHENEISADIAKTVIGSFIYLTTRHTWNKTMVGGTRLQVPETSLYEILQITRRRFVNWLSQCKQGILDDVMQTALQVSSSLTGSFKVSAVVLDNQNRWSRISGDRCISRFAVGSTRTVSSDNSNQPKEGSTSFHGQLRRQLSGDKDVGEVLDNGVLGVEIDLGLGQMTLRSKHLAALVSDIASHQDTLHIFGDATIQASMVERAENMQKYRLVGLNHEIVYWPEAHTACPVLGDEWEREYDPADLFDSEKWISRLFEPLRKTFFDGPSPPPMQFLMTEKQTPENAEVAVLLGLHQTIGGPWKLVYLFRRLKCIHIYECVSQGREWFFSLHLTTNVKYSLHELPPASENRNIQYPDFWIYSGGEPYPRGINNYLVNDITGASSNLHASLLIEREQQHHLNLSGGKETFVPSRLLFGIIPDAILESYDLWKDESFVPPGIKADSRVQPLYYRRMRGYPKAKDGEYMVFIEFFEHGQWEAAKSPVFNDPDLIQVTGFPGRSVRIIRRLKTLVEEEFRQRQRVASLLESLRLLVPPTKKIKEEEKKEESLDIFKIDTPVESDFEGKGVFWPCVIRRVNDDGSYDIEYVDGYKWVGIQRNIPADMIQKRGESEKKSRGEGVWHWEGMSDSEDDDWREEDTDEENEVDEDDSHVRKRIDYYQFDNLRSVLNACNGDEDICISILNRLGSVPGVMPFNDVFKLAKVVEETNAAFADVQTIGPAFVEGATSLKKFDDGDMVLLNLLYSPRRSRLHSLVKTLTRIENISHICAWTSVDKLKKNPDLNINQIEFGCPSIDLVELPRLKLAFTCREDHAGVLRLYSVDHVDLYVANESSTISASMLKGIPHSLILSNVRGEVNVLVPVIAPFRPRISYEPFSTFIVLDRKELASSERFFLYPVHVSFSFLLTKGLNSGVYLMLLRFMHRAYDEVFRLADSIATDSEFNTDGLALFKAFSRCNDDWHPDAHACRLKVFLVTMDSGMEAPWDLTTECARYSVKLDSVSSNCRLGLSEELQILESDKIVMSSNHAKYDPKIHSEYFMALCFNRRNYLRAVINGENSTDCKVPSRVLSSNWPFYQDNTVFGQNYESMVEVTSIDDGESSWNFLVKGGDETDAPSNGWLVVSVFHTLWSSGSIKVVPTISELIAIYQDMVSFVSVRADGHELIDVAKSLMVDTFPTIIIFRGGKEIERIIGPEKAVEKLVRSLAVNITEDDKSCHAKHRHRIKLEKALELGIEINDEEPKETGQLEWTFDPEHSGSSFVIDNDGMRAVYADDDEEDSYPPVWEYKMRYGIAGEWTAFPPEVQLQLEESFKTTFFINQYLYISGYEFQSGSAEVLSYEVRGITGMEYQQYNSLNVRRRGERVVVPGEEPFVSADQKEIDRRNAERKLEMIERKKQYKIENKGKDIETIRGSIGFLPNSGVHEWKFRWNHEPSLVGKGDGFGVCCEFLEDFSMGPWPRIGGSAGFSIGLYANGDLYYNGTVIKSVQGNRKYIEPTPIEAPSIESAAADASSEEVSQEMKCSEGDCETSELTDSKETEILLSDSEIKSSESMTVPTDLVPNELAAFEVKPNKEIAPLFGQGSIVGCKFDSGLDGGTLWFLVDSIILEELTVTDVYSKLTGNEVFPCVCLSQIHSEDVKIETKHEAVQEGGQETEAAIAETNANPVDPNLPEVEKDKYADFPSVTILSHDEEIIPNAVNTAQIVVDNSQTTETVADSIPTLPVGVSQNEAIDSDVKTSEIITGESKEISQEQNLLETKPDESQVQAEAPSSQTTDDKVLEVPIEKIRWMYEIEKSHWGLYSIDMSKEIELALREGKSEFKVKLNSNNETHNLKLENKVYSKDDGSGTEFRIRRHVVADGLTGMWEMLSLKYEKPYGLSGAGTLKIFEKVWNSTENTNGEHCGLGFLFLYALLTGDIRCKVIGGSSSYGMSGGYIGPSMPGIGSDDYKSSSQYYSFGRSSGTNDSHRFAVLLTQLYSDKHSKSLPASILNVLGRNKQVSLKMPKFKDTRKADHSPFFNGWIDELEPRSPLAELFGKLVPLMSSMKRKGAFVFPPPPPYPELPSPETICPINQDSAISDFNVPVLSDYGCDSRILSEVSSEDIRKFVIDINYRVDSNMLKPALPLNIDDTDHFNQVFKANSGRLIVVDFFASWCSPCKSLAPVFRQLSLQTPTALFLKVDVDDCDDLATKFEISSYPTVHFMYGGLPPTMEDIAGTIVGGGPKFVEEFMKKINAYSKPSEIELLKKFHANVLIEDSKTAKIFNSLAINQKDLDILANQPLRAADSFVTYQTRSELGLPPICGDLAFDVSQHEASKTSPAISVLNRFKNDVEAFANVANMAPISKMLGLSDKIISDYFSGVQNADSVLFSALKNIQNLKTSLEKIRDSDSQVVRYLIPLVYEGVNNVNISNETDQVILADKTKFLLSRYAARNSTIWVEYLFGALLSTKSIEDILKLNPYISKESLQFIFNLVSIVMLKANRLGHTNRCIGIVVGLESLLKKVLKVPVHQREENGQTLIPKVIQAGEDLSKTIVMGRYYIDKLENGSLTFDPRFLVFEFVWSIQLRKKQVDIVNDFRSCLSKNISKVRQMIMGAGKTSVVAPLLALILADGKSLVLSVVPKALVEMSRTRLRETFASIMVKRIYTLEYDRSTVVKPSMRRGLENAAINRGVVVATPTTIKSILLCYIEILQHLKEANAVGIASKIEELKVQANELAKILGLFKEGIMLLDEVDLILHPLKSELNFPIGEKFDLDGSEEGERWSLPIHLFDSIFYVSSGRISCFEQRGVALDVLKKISSVINEGYIRRHLQRLPHVTLLNMDFYESSLKPVMAEWAYLWLQQQHLHGIDKSEAIQYILEGAAARSDASTKLNLLDMAITKVMQEKGLASLEPAPTAGYVRSLTPQQSVEENQVLEKYKSLRKLTLNDNTELAEMLEYQSRHLEAAHLASKEQLAMVTQIYEIDEQIDSASKEYARSSGELQGSIISLHKSIETIECPRDSSLDNSVIVWCSPAFASLSGGSSNNTGEASVATICGVLEDSGLTVRRCAEPEEAISRARDLQKEGQLRCVIIGGEESSSGCGPSCVKHHKEKNCLRCGKPFQSHFGHECPIGGRGSFSLRDEAMDEKTSNLQTMKALTDTDSPYARKYSALPSSRTSIYIAQQTVPEEERMAFWRIGTTLFDDHKALVKWVNSQPTWPSDSQNQQISEISNYAMDKVKIEAMRSETEALESRKVTLAEEYELQKKRLTSLSAEKNELLKRSVDSRLEILTSASSEFKKLTDEILIKYPDINGEDYKGFVGPSCGRESAYALAWLEVFKSNQENLSMVNESTVAKVWKYHYDILNEILFLKQMALAAKVVAHVTSPNHKKMLNLCYNWLSTFFPHCLAKVNRVSFGLLSVEDCKAALEADPHVPRSRLKLAVPFVGKDVPSKSSEFAHPDIVIGMTVLAYRYSGLRKDDFVDIIDGVTSEFSKEIGPARERKSSQRHEDWVYAAGGRIRGLKSTKDGLPWNVDEANLSEDEAASKEVVQLKFLQKSNEEQMDKLFNLIRYEPIVIHYYLQKSIFPNYMRSQRIKLSASGQAIGGDMIFGKRVGFSGTPSDLLPQELGRCDYETGDDGMMLSTCLDRKIASYEVLQDSWSVDILLEKIAKSDNPRYHALIDTGALITGYSNEQVARQLLDRGLSWCDGVVFLDDEDKQQVLVRATGRVVSADQCGVSLEKRFAFYDQIHTTGMDIKHVVNAVAVITLGKDMVFRDYVQGAYRMRGIGAGQKIHVFIIPEVSELIDRELRKAVIPVAPGNNDNVLEKVVGWLIVNSLRSEQTQWTMLCLQNISNLYRKNAFKCLHNNTSFFFNSDCNKDESLIAYDVKANSNSEESTDTRVENFVKNIPPNVALKVFDEPIDFSLEASVPDPVPFEKRLRTMLDENENLLMPEQHSIGHTIMVIVGQFSMIEVSANRLDSEQEREQEQEQEKEIEARKDQQIEVEKYVDREYSRQEESQRPWPFSVLAKPFVPGDQHPFYHLKDFKLRHHESLQFPDNLLVSNNYFNQNWKGLRRVKNVIMVLEYSPSTGPDSLRLKTPEEARQNLSEAQLNLLSKAHTLLGFHAHKSGKSNLLSRVDVFNAIKASTDVIPTEELLDNILTNYGHNEEDGQYLSYDEFKNLLTSGYLFPESVGRYWVAVSLAEAETIRRILHVRNAKGFSELIPRASTELALRYSPLSTPTSNAQGGDGGVIFDCSKTWYKHGTKATSFESSVAHSTFRFFDCDMHFTNASLNILVRVLHASPKDRERFFLSTIGCKRRLERKWQDTPLAKVFLIADQWVALKQQAQSVYVVEALKAKGITLWEAFNAIDSDNNGILSPSEVYGALIWLDAPGITADDVVDFIEAADKNRDGMLDYREYIDILTESIGQLAEPQEETETSERAIVVEKIEPFGADEMREIMVLRKQREQNFIREERLRKQAYKEALDIKIFEEELEASKSRKGGVNPLITTTENSDLNDGQSLKTTDYKFSANELPLRFVASGKAIFQTIFQGTAAEPKIKNLTCKKKHELYNYSYYWCTCTKCQQTDTSYVCWTCYEYFCQSCYDSCRKSQEHDRRDVTKLPTYLRCLLSANFSLQIPSIGGANSSSGCFTATMEIRLTKLPAVGWQSLLRFSSPDANHQSRKHRASVFVNPQGFIANTISGAVVPEDSEIVKNLPKVLPAVWAIVSVVVNPEAGTFVSYINGTKCLSQSNIDSADLRLQNKIVVFGGGAQAQSKGGDIRRLVFHDAALNEESIQKLYFLIGNDSPAVGGRSIRIQSVYRGWKARKAKKDTAATLASDSIPPADAALPTPSDAAQTDMTPETESLQTLSGTETSNAEIIKSDSASTEEFSIEPSQPMADINSSADGA